MTDLFLANADLSDEQATALAEMAREVRLTTPPEPGARYAPKRRYHRRPAVPGSLRRSLEKVR